jgi:hypothetical protein
MRGSGLATETKETSIKTAFFEWITPDAMWHAIEKGELNTVVKLLENKKAAVNSVYGGCPPLYKSINLKKYEINIALLEHNANPNAVFDLTTVGGSKGTIIQEMLTREDLSNIHLLVLYGATPNNVGVNAPREAINPALLVATNAYIDYIHLNQLKEQLALALKENKQKEGAHLCQQLADFWEKQGVINRQFPDKGNQIYQNHYQAKAASYLTQKEKLLQKAEFSPSGKKGFSL